MIDVGDFNLAKLYDAPHVGIVGSTGSGKTTFAGHLFENRPLGRGIFLHFDPNDHVPGADVRVDYDRGEAWSVDLLRDYRDIEIILPASEADATAVVDEIRRDLFELGEAIGHDRPRFYVFIDEAHEIADLNAGDDNPMVRMAKRGRRHNIRLFIISQSPADVSKKALKQANYHVVFAIGAFEKGYFDTYGIDFQIVKNSLRKPDSHRFLVYDDFELHGPYKLDPRDI